MEGREAQEGGGICITLANLNSCMVETKTAWQSNFSPIKKSLNKQRVSCWNLPGDSVVKISPSNAGGIGSIPIRETKTPHASQPKDKTKHKTEAIL